jgi:hypothetical protein
VGKESEVAVVDHAAGEVLHDRLGLDMKVAKHLVATPATQEADNVAVHAGAE